MTRKWLKLEELQRLKIQKELEAIGFKPPVVEQDDSDEGDDTYEEHARAESYQGRYV